MVKAISTSSNWCNFKITIFMMIFKFSIIIAQFHSMDVLFKQIYLHLNWAILRVAVIIIEVVSENGTKSFLLELHLFIFYDHLLPLGILFSLFPLAQSF